MDDYLLAIDVLGSATAACGALAAQAPTLAAHVSRLLGVSRPSAGEMLLRLEQDGLVERGGRKELLLTARGRIAADRAVRRHRLLERLVCDVLGYPRAECFERARSIDDAFDDDAVERARAALGDPARCPHGWPVDPARAREESRELTTLAAVEPGRHVTVVRLAEHDGELLRRLAEVGLEPGARVTTGPNGSVAVGRTVATVEPDEAREILVRDVEGVGPPGSRAAPPGS